MKVWRKRIVSWWLSSSENDFQPYFFLIIQNISTLITLRNPVIFKLCSIFFISISNSIQKFSSILPSSQFTSLDFSAMFQCSHRCKNTNLKSSGRLNTIPKCMHDWTTKTKKVKWKFKTFFNAAEICECWFDNFSSSSPFMLLFFSIAKSINILWQT